MRNINYTALAKSTEIDDMVSEVNSLMDTLGVKDVPQRRPITHETAKPVIIAGRLEKLRNACRDGPRITRSCLDTKPSQPTDELLRRLDHARTGVSTAPITPAKPVASKSAAGSASPSPFKMPELSPFKASPSRLKASKRQAEVEHVETVIIKQTVTSFDDVSTTESGFTRETKSTFGVAAESAVNKPPSAGLFGKPMGNVESKPAAAELFAKPEENVESKSAGVFGKPAESKGTGLFGKSAESKPVGVFGKPVEKAATDSTVKPAVPGFAISSAGEPVKEKPKALSFGSALETDESKAAAVPASEKVTSTPSFGSKAEEQKQALPFGSAFGAQATTEESKQASTLGSAFASTPAEKQPKAETTTSPPKAFSFAPEPSIATAKPAEPAAKQEPSGAFGLNMLATTLESKTEQTSTADADMSVEDLSAQPAAPAASGFGSTASSGFGTTGFGGSSGFGGFKQPSFGGTQANPPAFGQPSAAPSAFGQVQAAATPSAFGQPSAAPSAFGQVQAAATPSAFGQVQPASAFGQVQPAATPSAFGQAQPAATPSAFGQTQPAATPSAFGQVQSTVSAFGTPSQTSFGQPSLTNTSPPASFGQSSFGVSAFGSPGALLNMRQTDKSASCFTGVWSNRKTVGVWPKFVWSSIGIGRV
jgi:hypothetical protein